MELLQVPSAKLYTLPKGTGREAVVVVVPRVSMRPPSVFKRRVEMVDRIPQSREWTIQLCLFTPDKHFQSENARWVESSAARVMWFFHVTYRAVSSLCSKPGLFRIVHGHSMLTSFSAADNDDNDECNKTRKRRKERVAVMVTVIMSV